MFSAIPRTYDLLNRLLTGGMDKRWRKQAARECVRHASGPVLDLCCGTGDLTLYLGEISHGRSEVLGLDFSSPMLEAAKRKAESGGFHGFMRFVHGDVRNLPFRDGCFSVIGISFAFRNLTYGNPLAQRYLLEVIRVLSPGGRFVILETSRPQNPLLRAASGAYYWLVVSPLGGMISGRREAYRYLAESARRFYTSEEVSDLLLQAGFSRVDARPLFGGVAALHVAVK
jgi:demethylmenaquinone methyltransferase/2-methoxy-6-polyprenyl-1,4-benzoquinol methylase